MHLYVMYVGMDIRHIFCSFSARIFSFSSNCVRCPSNRTKSNQRWMKLRTTVQLSSAIQKKPPLKREDSFLKRFSTRQIPETQVSQFNHPPKFIESIDIFVSKMHSGTVRKCLTNWTSRKRFSLLIALISFKIRPYSDTHEHFCNEFKKKREKTGTPICFIKNPFLYLYTHKLSS